MDLRLHFICDLVIQKLISFKFVSTQDNLSNFLTKPVGRSKINFSLKLLTSDSPRLPASSLAARSMPACQNHIISELEDIADSIMQEICKSIFYLYLNSGQTTTYLSLCYRL
jgi:hypothetical protein